MRSHAKSLALYQRACQVTPGGAQTASKAPGRVGPLGAFPLYVADARGAYVWDVDGHKFVDFFNGNCAVTLGHGYKPVVNAVHAAIRRYGALPSLPTALEAECAERLVALIPCAEQVRFLKTGSEATEAAIRIARRATGRQAIAVVPSDYNGWHSWSVARCAEHPGVPEAYASLLRPFASVNELEAALQPGDVAAVIVEPDKSAHMLADIHYTARRYGTLVIHDCMIIGNRWSVAGSDYFSVQPDLATYGKAFANGFPLAFVCGPADLMRHADVVSGTFGGEVAGLAACLAVLDEGTAPIERMWRIGGLVMDYVKGASVRLGLPCLILGVPCRFRVEWRGSGSAQVELATNLFQQELAAAGVLAHPSGWNPSAAHDAVAMECTFGSLEHAMGHMASYYDGARFDPTRLRGEPMTRPSSVRATT